MTANSHNWLSDAVIGYHTKRGALGLKNLMMEGMKEYEGKNVFVKLKDGRRYSGKVRKVENSIISLIDKFGYNVSFSETEIYFIEEKGAKNV